MRGLLAIAACVLLAGCWQSKGSLYADRVSLRPLPDGKAETHSPGNPKEQGRVVLAATQGGYRLTNDDRKDRDFGSSFPVRFFALSGAPSGTLVYEATDPCKPDDKSCSPRTAPRYYGLARISHQGAEIVIPECAKNDPLGKRPGVTADAYGTCEFSSRAELEKALQALAATNWKPNTIYRYTDAPR